MAHTPEVEHLTRASALLLARVTDVREGALARLRTEASSVLTKALRTCTLADTIIVVGLLGVFEGLLQLTEGWTDPFVEVDGRLKAAGNTELASRFQDLRDAVNALKHGEGRSYNRLLRSQSPLPFAVKARGAAYFDEGDVSEVARLVAAGSDLGAYAIAIIEEVRAELWRV